MTTLNTRAEMLTLIQNREFQALLDIHSLAAFEARQEEGDASLSGYYAGKWDEESSGVTLFSTPMRGKNSGSAYGTWLTVARYFGDDQLPFCVQAAEYSPIGVGTDLEGVGRFKTLGEALDCAFNVHEHGRIELETRGFDTTGRYVKGPAVIDNPDMPSLSPEALAVNFAMEDIAARREERLARQQEQSRLRETRYKAPVSLLDAPRLLEVIKTRLDSNSEFFDSTSSHIQVADSINRHFFNGEGYLLGCHNDDLRTLALEWDATTFVAMEVGADLIYLNHQGVFKSWEQGEQAFTSSLVAEYKPDIAKQDDGSTRSFCWITEWPFEGEYHEIYLDKHSSSPIKVISELPEYDPLDPSPVLEVVIDQVIAGVVHEHKVARERQLLKALRSEGIEL